MSRILSTLVLVSLVSFAHGQLLNEKGEKVHPYYISFESPTIATIEDVRGEFLHISYHDRIGQSELFTFELYDTKGQLVRELKLVKQFGQNYFDINLNEHGISLLENESYLCRLTNEKFEQLERQIRFVAEVKNEIVASILVKPKFLSCNDKKANNMVEFYGQVSGGMAPYKANWYVLNANRTDFLYLPTHIVVPLPGLTSSVQVDKDPKYFVLLHVTDACGNEQISTVQVVCDRKQKKVNTLFIEKLSDIMPSTSVETRK
jgi:hypothetical protein